MVDHPGYLYDALQMEITITVDRREPPVGRVCDDQGTEETFTGWLELIRVISSLVDLGR